MANLHLITVTAINSTTLTATFTENLNEDIGVANVTIQSQLNGINNSTVLAVSIANDTLTITCQPLVPLVSYFVIFQSTTTVPFNSINGDATLYQAGNTNQFLILAPLEQENPIQNFLINYLKNQIYDQVSNPSSIIGSIIQSLSYVLSRALYDVRQVKNENYLNFVVNDELKVRGSGPYDRLNEEAAYEILRVGLTPTGTNASLVINYTNFPANPVSLLAVDYTQILAPSSTDTIGTFNINDFILTVSNVNVSILVSVVFNYLDGTPNYTYNISQYGYQILDSTYDQVNAFSFATLANNQFKLSANILNDPNFSIDNIYQIQVNYQYRDLGRIIDQNSVTVTTVLNSSRETLPPLETVFNLMHAPITDSNGNPGVVGDVIFLDPNAYPPSTPHPAFVNELVFNLAALPSNVGDYAVDYPTGTVYVFGQDLTNSGTGPEPPLATYDYLYAYVSEIDYVYDATDNELVALPNGSLLANAGNINFNYEQVLIPGIDYVADLHIENLSENVENRLLGSNILQVENSPVTNVFRIFNQSTGEIYTINRWFNDKVYFSYINAPNVIATTRERASFQNLYNQILFVNTTITNTNNVPIYQCFLPNNQLVCATEDGLGSSINTSVTFSETDIFSQEIWFDINETISNNVIRLSTGQYMIDYANGIVYVAVSNSQSIGIGNINYKTNSITPINPYVLSVEDIYYQINFANPKNKEFAYQSLGNGSIIPASFDPSDEAYLNGNFTAPYQLLDGQVGAFVDNNGVVTFYPYVTNSIKYIRGLYEFNDLKYNISPINFASAATFSGQTINVNPLSGFQYANVKYGTDGYYVVLNQDILYQSPNITFVFSVTRNSDMMNFPVTVILGNPVILILSGSPNFNDAVTITYNISINTLSRIIANYDKGEYYIDYTYLADEIIISYEYGDNYLDFSQSLTLSPGDQYYASYNVGALRDALQKNFGALINIPELDQFEVNFVRERYRDALSAALSSFLQGPSLSAIKNLVQTISHIEPEITESAFVNWSLGSSLLVPSDISTTGAFDLVPAKYASGAVINTLGQTISLPLTSNLRIEEGTFETWIIPEWDGIDNNSQLNIAISKDGYVFNSNYVFVGPSEYHPEYLNGMFSLDKNSNVSGIPQKNKDGVYIYYAPDVTNTFNRWFFEVIDGYSNYSDDGYSTNYTIQITIDGLFYDVKSINYPKPNNLRITSGTNTLSFSLNFNLAVEQGIDQGITFVADREYYILDAGQGKVTNRLSIYKDPSGYINFRVYDKLGNAYSVSANISSWVAGDPHQVAAAWVLNSFNRRDELHLFLDGFEVPNIIRYGSPVQPYLHEKYRTVNPEEIAGQVSDNIVGSVDLVTTANSATVTSSLNFTAYGIVAGAVIYIQEAGFSTAGYSITNVNGNTLTLSVPMPLSITDGVFSINMQSFIMQTPIDIYPNITVSTISSILDGIDGYITAGSSLFSSVSYNFGTEDILPGYLLRIDDSNFANNYVILNVSGNTLLINGIAPDTISGATFHLYQNIPVELPGIRALRPDYSISEDGYFNPILTITNGVEANDLILVETLGLNNRLLNKYVYQWGSSSNILQTLLPPPVSLNQTNIYHVLLPPTLINGSNTTFINNTFSFDAVQTVPTNNFEIIVDGYNDGYVQIDQPQFITLSSIGSGAGLTASGGVVTLYEAGGFFPVIVDDTITITNAASISNNGSFQVLSYIANSVITYSNPSAPDGDDANNGAISWSWISSLTDSGRTISVTISSDHNLNYTSPVLVTLTGMGSTGSIAETIDFVKNETLLTSNKFETITAVSVDGYYYNANRSFMTLTLKEAYPVTIPENNTPNYPVIRYSYQVMAGSTLYGSSNAIADGYGFFSSQDVNNYIVITSPASAAGSYQILAVSSDHSSATIDADLPAFSGGSYQVLNISASRSGFQNGFFVLEQAKFPGVPYYLEQGSYQFEYYTYISIKLSPLNLPLYLGTDFNGDNLLFGIIDETKITSDLLTDTRVGEVVSANQESITKDFNSLKALTSNSNTLVLCHYDSFPFINSAETYASTITNNFIQSSITVNDNFEGSAALYSEPIIVNNAGILSSQSSGTIEFWVSPKFDTNNDPNYRYYFDASSNIIEEAISMDEVTVSVSGVIGQVLSVTVKDGNSNIDYFAGGRVETSATGAIVEDTISLTSSSARVSKQIFQVVTVKIANDPTNTDYFAGGNIGTDGRTIYLGKQLPNNNLSLIIAYRPVNGTGQTFNSQVIRLKIPLPYPTTSVVVTYIPAGVQGDRISIFKDPYGFVNFNVYASGVNYLVRSPAFWSQNTWHRVRATYQFNSGLGNDTIRLFVDGYEHGNILFGTGLIFGEPYVFGSTFIGGSNISTNIVFKDTLNELYLGSDYTQNNNAFILMANCRFSNIARPVFAPFGESIDVNYNSNLAVVFPVTQDLYTTLLLNFGNLTALANNLAVLINSGTGAFDFTINVIDSFGIVLGSAIVQQTLVALLNALKPATSAMFITYTE
jgi:hypothetical protein